MTIYSGKTRISEEEDLWRVIGIHEVTDPSDDDRQIISGYMMFPEPEIDDSNPVVAIADGDNIPLQGSDFYCLLDTDPDIYHDLNTRKYRYKRANSSPSEMIDVLYDGDFNNTSQDDEDPCDNPNTQYPCCTLINGYYIANGFYTTPITPEDHAIYYDPDTTQYYIYKQNAYETISQYTYTEDNNEISTLYYHEGGFYEHKTDVGPDIISILKNGEYEQHPYIQGLLRYNTFYSDEVTFDTEHLYYNNDDDTYYYYDEEEEILVESSYEYISPPDANDEVFCLPPGQTETESKILITGYKIGNRFFQTVSAGYKGAIIPDGTDDTTNVYLDQLNNAYYFLTANGFVHMPIYEQFEVHETHNQSASIIGRVLYYHNYENENVLHSRTIIDGYYVDGSFYTIRENGDDTAIYQTTGTNNFWQYDSSTHIFRAYEIPTSYEIGIFYSGNVNPSINYFYEDSTGDIYYYDGTYRQTNKYDGYYISPVIMCDNKITFFEENNENLYYNILNDGYYIYKDEDGTLVKTIPVFCYIIDDEAYIKQRPAIGAIYYAINTDAYFIYNNGVYEWYDYENGFAMSNQNQIVLSLTKQDMLIDDNILDQHPYDEDVILQGADSTHAGLLTSELYDMLISLDNRYKMTVSTDTYPTLADLEAAAPTNTNYIYIVGGSEQYVLSDNGSYVQIGNTDLSTLDLDNVASIDDLRDILEHIKKQDLNLQGQLNILDNKLDSKYSTANIITNVNNLTNSAYQNDAVSGKVLVEYITDLLSTSISLDSLVTETVVERVEKYEDSIRVYYKDIVTAAPPAYINDSLNSNLADANHTFSARLLKSVINDLQDQIENIVDDDVLVFTWGSDDLSDASIVLSINNKVV